MESEILPIGENATVPSDENPSGKASRAEQLAAPALILPRMVIGLISDIRSIAQSTRHIASLAENLALIERHVEEMGDEVRHMRQGVDVLHPEVVSLRAAVEPLEEQLGAVRSLARIAARLPGGGGRAARRREAEQAHPKAVDLAEEDLELDPRSEADEATG
jgi:hypothetical protein